MRYRGRIGFRITEQRSPGSDIYVPKTIFKKYKGDVPRMQSSWAGSQEGGNSDLNISHTISIVADPFLSNNYRSIFCVEFAGEYWNVKTIQILPPRLNITIGGVYTGDEPTP